MREDSSYCTISGYNADNKHNSHVQYQQPNTKATRHAITLKKKQHLEKPFSLPINYTKWIKNYEISQFIALAQWKAAEVLLGHIYYLELHYTIPLPSSTSTHYNYDKKTFLTKI